MGGMRSIPEEIPDDPEPNGTGARMSLEGRAQQAGQPADCGIPDEIPLKNGNFLIHQEKAFAVGPTVLRKGELIEANLRSRADGQSGDELSKVLFAGPTPTHKLEPETSPADQRRQEQEDPEFYNRLRVSKNAMPSYGAWADTES